MHLKNAGFAPETIVDVGVGYGTPNLYEIFPNSYYALIEPLKEFEPSLQDILKTYKGEYFLTAVGARDEKQMINVEPNKLLA